MSIDSIKTEALVPMAGTTTHTHTHTGPELYFCLDFLNHHRSRQSAWSYDAAKDEFFISALRDIPAHTEVGPPVVASLSLVLFISMNPLLHIV